MNDFLLTVLAVVAIWAIIKLFTYKLFFGDLIRAAAERDPAATGSLVIIFTYAGVKAMAHYRVAHALHGMRLKFLSRALSQWARYLTGIEIHPGATIGKKIFIDHGMGVVVGETAVIGDNVTLFQGVTLGGTGKEKGKRHPTIGSNVVIGAGAKVLGNIQIGDNVSVGANAVVLQDVPANSTVVGVPGRIARLEGRRVTECNIDYTSLPDPLAQAMDRIQREIEKIEHELEDGEDKKR